jgi:hypothetical protein
MIRRMCETVKHHPGRVSTERLPEEGVTIIHACGATLTVPAAENLKADFLVSMWMYPRMDSHRFFHGICSKSLIKAIRSVVHVITQHPHSRWSLNGRGRRWVAPMVIITSDGIIGADGVIICRASFLGQERVTGPGFLVSSEEAIEMAMEGSVRIDTGCISVIKEAGELRLQGEAIRRPDSDVFDAIRKAESVERRYSQTTRGAEIETLHKTNEWWQDYYSWDVLGISIEDQFLYALPPDVDICIGVGTYSDMVHAKWSVEEQKVEAWFRPMQTPKILP